MNTQELPPLAYLWQEMGYTISVIFGVQLLCLWLVLPQLFSKLHKIIPEIAGDGFILYLIKYADKLSIGRSN